jgi:hypothetical protein
MSSMKNLYLEDVRSLQARGNVDRPITSLPKPGDRWGISYERG